MRLFWILACIAVLAAASGCRAFSRTASAPNPADDSSGLAALRPARARDRVRAAMGRGVDETAARQAYSDADALFQQASDAGEKEKAKLFHQAADKYAVAAERFPDSMLQEDALFMKGEAHFFADEYSDSQKAYEKLIAAYPNTRHIDRVDARRFDIAQYWLAVHRQKDKFFLTPNFRDEKLPHNDTFGNAVRVFDKVRLDDPTGRLADDATMAAASAHFANGDYSKAEIFLADLRRTYPESEHQFDAALLGIKAKTELYKGADYDSQHLEEALQLIDLTLEQFPQQAAEHREYLDKAYKDARVKLALRDWRTAQFYDNRAQYGGARRFYVKVVQEFSDTSLAADAEKRLKEIDGLPDKPEQPAQWLVDRIPEKDNQHKPLISGNPMRWLRR